MADKDTSLMSSLEVLQSLLENSKNPLAAQFNRWKLWNKWSDVVGASLGEVTEPVNQYRGILIVWVQSSSLLSNLQFMKEQMIKTINAKNSGDPITDIRFTLNRHLKGSNAATDTQELKDGIKKFTPQK
jgi:predicted nucleic acid-binding Zn ribbon protein